MAFLLDYNEPLRTINELDYAISLIFTCGSQNDSDFLGEFRFRMMSMLLNKASIDWSCLIGEFEVYCKKNNIASIENAYQKMNLILTKNRNAYIQSSKYPHSTFWPNPTDPRSVSRYDVLPIRRNEPLFNRGKKIISIGSCFAHEITKKLKEDDYNYYITELSSTAITPHSFSANWGTVYNPLAFEQMIEYYLENCHRPSIYWSSNHLGSKHYFDIFREDVYYNSLLEAKEDIETHRCAAKEALLGADILVLTLGLTEIWCLNGNGYALARAPWRLNPSVCHHRLMDYDQVLNSLNKSLNLLHSYNPTLQIIVSVSPVPMHASFSKNYHVIESNEYSKSTLRSAIQYLADRFDFLHYFPSYEVVTQCCRNPWSSDERHVNTEAVEKVFETLYAMYAE